MLCKSLHFDIEELTLLSSRIGDYPTITQGKTRIPGVNDAEEFEALDVSLPVQPLVF
jgi:myosin heavy subunit